MKLFSAAVVDRQHRSFLAGCAFVALLVAPAHADDSERARIAHERAEIEARYAAQDRACRERFVVSSCVDDAKRERREGLDALRARQLKLDEELRRERTSSRRAELAAKAAEDARREQERAARAASAPQTPRQPRSIERRHEDRSDAAAGAGSDAAAGRERRDRPVGDANPLGIKPTRRASAEERSDREARNRASYETRQRQAAEHRERVLETTRKRLQQHPAGAPLLLPAGSAPR